ncbi:MAG: YncE family protein [Planctomycetota bacterium]
MTRTRRLAVSVGKIAAAAALLACWLAATPVDAEDDWIGPTATGPARRTAPEHLRGKSVTQASSTLTDINLPADKIVRNMIFSDDGKTVWILQSDGILHALAVPSLRRVGQLRIGSRCHSLARSALGLLASLDGREELWVIDPKTLAVRKKIDVERILAVVASPRGGRAYCSTQTDGKPNGLAVVDLGTDRVLRHARVRRFGQFRRRFERHPRRTTKPKPGVPPEKLAVTLDGRYLLTGDGHQLCRYACAGGGLVPQEARDCDAWALSPDGRYVVMDHRVLYKTAVFARPVRTLPDAEVSSGLSNWERWATTPATRDRSRPIPWAAASCCCTGANCSGSNCISEGPGSSGSSPAPTPSRPGACRAARRCGPCWTSPAPTTAGPGAGVHGPATATASTGWTAGACCTSSSRPPGRRLPASGSPRAPSTWPCRRWDWRPTAPKRRS